MHQEIMAPPQNLGIVELSSTVHLQFIHLWNFTTDLTFCSSLFLTVTGILHVVCVCSQLVSVCSVFVWCVASVYFFVCPCLPLVSCFFCEDVI